MTCCVSEPLPAPCPAPRGTCSCGAATASRAVRMTSHSVDVKRRSGASSRPFRFRPRPRRESKLAPMTLAPLLQAPPAITLHAFAALAAFSLGIVQFAAPKGTIPHRTIGWIWVILMLAVALKGVNEDELGDLVAWGMTTATTHAGSGPSP